MTPQLAALVPAWYRPPHHPPQTIDAACAVFGFSRADLTGNARFAGLVRARWAVMLAMHRRGYSTPRIGRALGGRDHTTVMHGLLRGKLIEASNPEFASKCAAVAAA